MVATGLGVSLLPALYVRSEVEREALVTALPLDDPQPSRKIGMVWRVTAARDEAYEAIATLIRETLAKAAPEVRILPPE